MAELELTEEERALLAAAEAPENPVVSEPVAVVDDDELVSPPPVESPKRRGRPRKDPEQVIQPREVTGPLEEAPLPPGSPVTAGALLPDEGNRTVPPAQCDYGDPWGRLPTQMRHMSDGTPAF